MKKQIHFILIAITSISLALFGCNKTENIHRTDRNSIVLIFDTIRANYDTLFLSSGPQMIKYAPVLAFNSETQGEHITPIMKIEKDTIVLNIQSDHFFINYRYNPISAMNFIAKKGDTIVIDEKRNTPFIRVLNRKAKELDINYFFWKKSRFGSVYDYSTEDYYNNLALYYITKGISMLNGKKIAIGKLTKELKNEDIWLDSLFNNKSLSDYEYSMYKMRNKYQLLDLELENKDTLTLRNYLKEYSDSIYQINPTGLYSPFYWNCLGIYMDKLTKQSFDYKQLFDQLDHINLDLGTLSTRVKSV